MKNLDDGLMILLIFHLFRCLTGMLRLGGFDCKGLMKATYGIDVLKKLAFFVLI